MLSLIDTQIRRTLISLAAEFAYMAIVDTSIIHPRSLLRRKLIKVVTPELVSFLAMKIGGDEPDVGLNSLMGVRLGGVPRCELLNNILPELYQLCKTLRMKGGEPLFKVLPEVITPLSIAGVVAGFEEADILLTSYRAVVHRGERELTSIVKYFDKWFVMARL
ncbi:MAG: hypothetical protein QXT46_00220 [Pyrobaculum sp.]